MARWFSFSLASSCRVVALAVATLLLGGCVVAGADSPAGEGLGGSHPTTAAKGTPADGFAGSVIAWRRSVEEGIARCMAERGFEYIPYVPAAFIDETVSRYETDGIEVRPDVDGYLWAPLFPMEEGPASEGMLADGLERARHVGYEIFFNPRLLITQAVEPVADDPNATVVGRLSGEERRAYFVALHGYAPSDVSDGVEPVESAIADACSAKGRLAAGPEPAPPSRLNAIDIDLLNDLGQKVYVSTQQDPRLIRAATERAACLADKGAPADPYNYVIELLKTERNEATGDAYGVIDADGDKEAAFAREFGVSRLKELQALEIDMAVAEYECGIPYARTNRSLIAEYEQRLLDENPDVAALLNLDES